MKLKRKEDALFLYIILKKKKTNIFQYLTATLEINNQSKMFW